MDMKTIMMSCRRFFIFLLLLHEIRVYGMKKYPMIIRRHLDATLAVLDRSNTKEFVQSLNFLDIQSFPPRSQLSIARFFGILLLVFRLLKKKCYVVKVIRATKKKETDIVDIIQTPKHFAQLQLRLKPKWQNIYNIITLNLRREQSEPFQFRHKSIFAI